MTTIACDGKMIAGDGLVSGDGMIHCTDHKKVYRLNDGRVMGFSGSIWLVENAIEYLNGTRDTLDIGDDCEMLVLDHHGVCTSYDGKGRSCIVSTPCVTGSGGAYALAAMRLGKVAFEAVKLACEMDTTSGGSCTFMVPMPCAKELLA